MTPLGLATVAALTPPHFNVDIWDEGLLGPISERTDLAKDYDLVGVTGYITHTTRMKELGQLFRGWGIKVVVGGPGVSTEPEAYRNDFDILFIGEAEHIWPRFLQEWEQGEHRDEYRQVSKIDMQESPMPRWDKVDMSSYRVAGVQSTRGCPFDCEFCDVIYIYGRQARHKSIEQVLREVQELRQLGADTIFFCDDNFIGNPAYGKALLRGLVSQNRSSPRPVFFFTQISLNVAADDEFLELLAEANFLAVFIGIESTNIDSLKETNKPQNYRVDIAEAVKKVHSYGIIVSGGMIVGFDHDDETIFDRHFEFLQDTGIPNPSVNVLKAPTGTKLWVRLHKEGRIVDSSPADFGNDICGHTNIIPTQMTRAELLTGFRNLVERVRDWRNFEARVKKFISLVQRHPGQQRQRVSWRTKWTYLKVFLFTMDKEARSTTLRLLVYTKRHAPSMVGRVTRMISRQYFEKEKLPLWLEEIDSQIRWEIAGAGKLRMAEQVFFVPEQFRKPYRTIFPELHTRVYVGLADKSRLHDALVEVVYDFITRWGLSFRNFEEHHRSFLHELCDRTIAKENANCLSDVGQNGHGETSADMAGLTDGQVKIRLRSLSDDILRAVEQELRGFIPVEKTAPPSVETSVERIGGLRA